MPARSHGKCRTPIYVAWANMMGRCYNPNHPCFKHYGERGIAVCQVWHDFAAFYAAVGDPPSGMTLERADNDRGYEPDNVCWATQKQQTRNTRQNHLITYEGETLCLSDWSIRTGISRDTLAARCRADWPIERVLTEPVARWDKRKHTEEARAKMRKPKPKRQINDPRLTIT